MKVPVQGRIADYPVYRIVQELIRDKSTGILTVSGTEDTIVITFEFGLCVGAESHYPSANLRLGELLVKRRYITEVERDQLLKKQQSALIKLGSLAREDGHLSSIQLMDVLEDQMMLVLFPTLTWTGGLYHFRTEESVHYDQDAFRPLDLKSVEDYGDKILKTWTWIQDRFPSFESIPILLSDVEVLPPGMKVETTGGDAVPVVLTLEQERVYNLINGVFNIQDIMDSGHQFPWLTLTALADLEDSGAISIPAMKETVPKYSVVIDDFWDRFRGGMRYLLMFGGIVAALVVLIFMPVRLLPQLESRAIDHEREIFSKVKMDQIRFALSVYQLTNRRFPDFLRELQEMRYVRSADLVDSWGAKFYYSKTDIGYELKSGGADREWATEDDISIEMDADEYANGCYFPLWKGSNNSEVEITKKFNRDGVEP